MTWALREAHRLVRENAGIASAIWTRGEDGQPTVYKNPKLTWCDACEKWDERADGVGHCSQLDLVTCHYNRCDLHLRRVPWRRP